MENGKSFISMRSKIKRKKVALLRKEKHTSILPIQTDIRNPV